MINKKKKLTKREIKEDKLVTGFYNTLAFFNKNKSRIFMYGGISIAAIFLIVFFVYNGIQKNQTAALELSRMTPIYEIGNYREAINGKPGTNLVGLKYIVDNYGSSENGEIAKIYLANSYSFIGKNEEAFNYYKEYNGNIDMYKAAALSGQAKYYVLKNNFEKAAELFEKAAHISKSVALNPEYLLNAGINYLELGNKEKAKENFDKIKNDYKKSLVNSKLAKYLAEVE